MNVLSESKRQQVVALGRLGWPVRRIQKEIGVRRETASAYLKAAGVPVRGERHRQLRSKPASEVSTDPGDSKPASQGEVSTDCEAKPANDEGASTDSGLTQAPPAAAAPGSPDGPAPPPPPGRAPSASACEPYREVIEEALGRGRNAMAIYQDLVDRHAFPAKYSSVKRFVHTLAGQQSPEARAVIVTEPGQEAQVDYGEGPMVRHPKTGKYRRTRLFVLTLGASRKSVRLIVFNSSSRTWAELHEEGLRRLGGAPRIVVLDNLREGVLKADIYDPTLNPLYRDMLAHYGITALPCRVRDPDRKGKVESGVGHAQRTPLKGMRFESLDEAQRYLDQWEERWADTRIHGTTKRQVAAMFAEEQPFLQPLPVEPFRYYQYGERIVHLDGHVEVERAYYSVPPGRIGSAVDVQWDDKQVRILDRHTGELLREHRRNGLGRYHTTHDDRPARVPMSTHDLLRRSDQIGAAVGLVCRQIHARDGEIAVRRILGILHLARHYGAETVNEACTAALELGVPSYRFVRRYLERPHPQPSLKQIDPLIRELTQYRDLIAARTKENPA
jgi:transposase